MVLSFVYFPAQDLTESGSSRIAPWIFESLSFQSFLARTSRMTRSGFPSIALSSSFVILGTSADVANVASIPTIKKMSKGAINNLFFIPYLLASIAKFLQPKKQIYLKLNKRVPQNQRKSIGGG